MRRPQSASSPGCAGEGRGTGGRLGLSTRSPQSYPLTGHGGATAASPAGVRGGGSPRRCWRRPPRKAGRRSGRRGSSPSECWGHAGAGLGLLMWFLSCLWTWRWEPVGTRIGLWSRGIQKFINGVLGGSCQDCLKQIWRRNRHLNGSGEGRQCPIGGGEPVFLGPSFPITYAHSFP